MDPSSDLCPPSPPQSSPVLKNRSKHVSFLDGVLHSPPPSSPVLEAHASLGLSGGRSPSGVLGNAGPRVKSGRVLSFSKESEAAKKSKRRKKPAIIYWKLTTMTSPDFNISRLTERQQLSLFRKKEALGLRPEEKPSDEMAKLLSPYLMDQMAGEFHSWAKKDSAEDPASSESGKKPLREACTPDPVCNTLQMPQAMRKRRQLVPLNVTNGSGGGAGAPSTITTAGGTDLRQLLPPPAPPSTPMPPEPGSLAFVDPYYGRDSWKSSLPSCAPYTLTLRQYHYDELRRWIAQLHESLARRGRVAHPCCSVLERRLVLRLETERSFPMGIVDMIHASECRHVESGKISSLCDILARQQGERTVLEFFQEQ